MMWKRGVKADLTIFEQKKKGTDHFYDKNGGNINRCSTLKKNYRKNISSVQSCQTAESLHPNVKHSVKDAKSPTEQYAQMIHCHIGTLRASLFVHRSGGCLSWLALIFHYSAHFSSV